MRAQERRRALQGQMFSREIVLAFEWLPIVTASERLSYEAEAQSSGLTDYRFWERGPKGERRTAGARPFYVPVHYMEPPSAAPLGYDVASDPGAWRVAMSARDTGESVISPPVRLIERAENARPVVLVYRPVYRGGDPASEALRREALTGFAIMIIQVAPVVLSAALETDAVSIFGFSLR